MAYTKQTWADGSGGSTPINAARLTHMEDGISLGVNGPRGDYNAKQLRRWTGALGNVDNKPADIVFVGDSLTEGYSASSDNTRWTNLVRKALQTSCNPSDVPGGEGYIASHHTVDPAAATGNVPNRWTYTNFGATPTSSIYSAGFGLGKRYLTMSATNMSISITVTGDRIWVYLIRGSGAGRTVINIDGSDVDTYDAYQAPIDTYAWDSGPLSSGSHTITLSPTTGSTGGVNSWIDGIMVFNGDGGSAYNTGKGVRAWEAGVYGATSASLYGTGWMDVLASVRTDLAVVGLIVNDASNGTDLTTYGNQIDSLIDNIRWYSGVFNGEVPCSILLWAPPKIESVSQSVWDSYVDVLRTQAFANNCAFIDIGEVLPTYSISPELFNSDTLHYSDAMQKILAAAILDVIAPAGSWWNFW